MRALFVYHSKYGQTAKIARHMADLAENLDWLTKLVHVDDLNPSIVVEGFDAVVVGCPIYRSQHSSQVADFIRSHCRSLAGTHSMFYSVSMAAASNPHEQAEARALVETFLAQIGWQPNLTVMFAGAVNYRDYNWFIRWVMKRISAKRGGSTDTSQNHEYTDWEQVEAVAGEFFQSAHCADRPDSGQQSEPTSTGVEA